MAFEARFYRLQLPGMAKLLFIVLSPVILSGCLGMSTGVSPVKDFDVGRYMGKWYEIARLDHSFERGLENVSAHYSIREDGGVTVLNRGYSPDEREWREAHGKAYFVSGENEGYLKVSFFGPFYGSYVIFGLDKENYQYAFVSGPNTSYLWLLSREPSLPSSVIDTFIEQSRALGFDVDNLIFVRHDGNP